VNFVGYPLGDLDGEPLRALLQGAFDALEEADCAMAGGHSIADREVKFGFAVVGTVHPDRIVRNSTARPGDRLLLTKPLGMGCLTTALKQQAADPEHVDAAHRLMARLNRNASEAMLEIGVSAATDITGFGLLGHAWEMAEGADVSVRIEAGALPVLPAAGPYLDERFLCGGTKRNESFAKGRVRIEEGVDARQRLLLHDVQTSGGLLIAVPAERAERLLEALRAGGDTWATAIGVVAEGGPALRVVAQ